MACKDRQGRLRVGAAVGVFEEERAAALIANPDNPPPSGIPPAELAAWTAVANVLLNLDETLMKR